MDKLRRKEFLKIKKDKKIKYPIELVVFLLGDKWKFIILCKLMKSTKRFGELEKSIGDISSKVLTQQLKELEAFGFISRKTYDQIPPRVEYSVTELGKTLTPIMKSMFDWGMEYSDEFNWLENLEIDKDLKFPYN
ncbi:putative HTH-type transcriptional regulator YtcD [bioreactor metagenome]|uniref:Putative HTH-type transcriptional regulator YtcD n=1 Tax=bioreactor metagenome TaxID=1076179 RepID=A0A645FHF6_9ZZZZ